MQTVMEPTCKPRNYQLEILYTALNENTLAFLPTGAGKTLISVLFMKHRLNLIRKRMESGANKKIIVFLAPTKILVQQQRRYISANSDACVKAYTGETKNPDGKIIGKWDKSHWKKELSDIDIMVSTPEIVKQILQRKFFPMELFDSVILDECHHAFGNHPMAGVCEYISRSRFYRPRMLGMTASPLPCKKGSIATKVHQLESITGCRLVAPKDTILELREAVPIPSFNLLRYADMELRWPFHCNDEEESPRVSAFNKPTSPMTSSSTPVALRIKSDALKVLSHAYDRLKFADYVSDIQLLLTTLNMKSSEMPELNGLVLWDTVPPSSSIPTDDDDTKSSKSLLPKRGRRGVTATNTNFAKACLSDLRQAMGQILGVLEDCGLICAINALITVLDTYSFAPIQNLRRHKKSRNNDESTLFILTNSMTSKVNLDRVLAIKNELLDCAFEAIELADYEFVVHSSLLEIFAALSSGLGSEKCLRAASEIRTRIQENREERRKNDELVQKITEDLSRGMNITEGINNDSNSINSNSNIDVEDIVNNSNGESHMRINEEAAANGTENATTSPTPMIATPTISSLPPDPDIKYYTKFEEVDMALQAIHDILYVLGNNKDPLIEIGSLGIARLLYKRLEGKDSFPSFQRLRSVIQTSCIVLLNTFSIRELSSLMVYDSFDNMLVLEPLIIPSELDELTMTSPTLPVPPPPDTQITMSSEIPLISRKAKALLYYLLRHSPTALQRTQAFAKSFTSTKNNYNISETTPGTDKALISSSNNYDLKVACFDLPDNWAAIVFCKMRLTAKALCTLLTSLQLEADPESIYNADTCNNTLFSNTCGNINNNSSNKGNNVAYPVVEGNTDGNDRSGIHSLRPVYITGKNKEKVQHLALTDFRSGKYNILFATDVAEEGLDVRACQLVVNYDLPSTVKSFIQRRGRARAVNSQMIAIIPLGVKGNNLLNEFIRFTVQEKEMESHGQRGAGISKANLSKDEDEICSLADLISTLCRSQETAGVDMELDEDDDDDDNPSAAALPFGSMNTNATIYTVHRTGASIDAGSATQMLTQFCQQLPHDCYFLPQPIFWMCPGYRCAILLPSSVSANIRCVLGPVASRKSAAKGLASLMCIRNLHQSGELTDWLLPSSRFSNEDFEGESLDEQKKKIKILLSQESTIDIFKGKVQLPLPVSGAYSSLDCSDEDEIDVAAAAAQEGEKNDGDGEGSDGAASVVIDVKVVPDLLYVPSSTVSSSSSSEVNQVNDNNNKDGMVPTTTLYLYASRVEANESNIYLSRDLHNCENCSLSLQSLNQIGLAFLNPLPPDVTTSYFKLHLSKYFNLQGSFQFLGVREVPHDELIQMQRFHQGVLCWEKEVEVVLEDSKGKKTRKPIPPSEWSASSRGCWYLVFPIPAVMNHITPQGTSPLALPFPSPQFDWLSFLTEAADDVQHTVNIMIDQYKQQKLSQAERVTIDRTIKYHHTAKDLNGKLIRRGPSEFYIGLPDTGISLSDIMCYVRERKDGKVFRLKGKEVQRYLEIQATKEMTGDSIDETAVQNTDIVEDNIRPQSYADYYKSKWDSEASNVIDTFSSDPAHRLLRVHGVTGHLSYLSLLGSMRNKFGTGPMPVKKNRHVTRENISKHRHSEILLIPETCELIGEACWYLFGLYAPSLIWRLQSLLISIEAKSNILHRIHRNNIWTNELTRESSYLRGIISTGGDITISTGLKVDSNKIADKADRDMNNSNDVNNNYASLSHDNNSTNHAIVKSTIPMKVQNEDNVLPVLQGPQVSLMLEALSPRMTLEDFDSEGVEMLGDSLLKFVTSIEIYFIHLGKHEGHLSSLRSKVVCNDFLTNLAIKTNMQTFIRVFPIRYGKGMLRLRPPGMSSTSMAISAIASTASEEGVPTPLTEEEESQLCCVWNCNVLQRKGKKTANDDDDDDDDDDDLQADNDNDAGNVDVGEREPLPQHILGKVNKKVLADVLEAVVGGFYLQDGVLAGASAMKAIGIWPQIPPPPTQQAQVIAENGPVVISMDAVPDPSVLISDCSLPVIPEGYPKALERIAIGFNYDTAQGKTDSHHRTTTKNHHAVSNGNSNSSNNSNGISLQPNSNVHYIPISTVDQIELKLGYRFKNLSLLDEALTHCSCQHKPSNQRLEFLGDAILDFAIVTLLYSHRNKWCRSNLSLQGELSFQKSQASCNKNLGAIALNLALYKYLEVMSQQLVNEFNDLQTIDEDLATKKAQNERKSRNSSSNRQYDLKRIEACKPSVAGALADLMEALIGAIFLDSGGSIDSIYSVIKKIQLLPQIFK